MRVKLIASVTMNELTPVRAMIQPESAPSAPPTTSPIAESGESGSPRFSKHAPIDERAHAGELADGEVHVADRQRDHLREADDREDRDAGQQRGDDERAVEERRLERREDHEQHDDEDHEERARGAQLGPRPPGDAGVLHATILFSIASRSQSMPRPTVSGARARPSSIVISVRVIAAQLRDVLDVAAVRDRGDEADVQLHQEVRADVDVERLGQVRDLQPGRDPADAGDVDLDDAGRAAVEVLAELRDRVHRLADRDRDRGGAREAHVALDVVGRERLLEPAEVEPVEAAARGGWPRSRSSTGWRRP